MESSDDLKSSDDYDDYTGPSFFWKLVTNVRSLT